jgi:RNA polymerase sigma-70 factor, ECF subfamily
MIIRMVQSTPWPVQRLERTKMKANSTTSPELDALLCDAAAGDAQAVRGLLERHRAQLRRMIASRLDHRLAPRLDPSDVVQETLADAVRRLPDYLRDRPIPFDAWLFRLALDRLARTHRHHVASMVRGIGHERRLDGSHPGEASGAPWGDRLKSHEPTPGGCLVREERRFGLAAALARMNEADREVIGLRYLDQLAFDEIAAILEIGLSAAKMRHLRALERLRVLLEELGVEPSTSS